MPKNDKDVIQRVEEYCKQNEVPEPIEFLLSVMRGVDPRPIENMLFEIIEDIGRDDLPTEEQWRDICYIVLNNPAYQKQLIDSDTAIRAAEKVIDYVHPKLKSVELSGSFYHQVHLSPITEEEAEAFDKWWAGAFA